MSTPKCLLILVLIVVTVTGECRNDIYSHVPTLIYDDLKCIAKRSYLDFECPLMYECSRIFDRPQNTCHFKGKTYEVDEEIEHSELLGVLNANCRCSSNLEFTCAEYSDGCPEDRVSGYLKPNCYLRYKLNSYCADGMICPLVENYITCEVNGVTYKEGNKFKHPNEKCVECVCDKGFNDKLEAPFCQKINCTAELKHSKYIDNYCAPFYGSKVNACCPDKWICPSTDGIYYDNPSSSPEYDPNIQCRFGTKFMLLGELYKYEDPDVGKITCECNIPPFLYCHKNN